MPQISFEFFPPQTARGRTNLVRTAHRLAEFQPGFYSVTYGAGGSTRVRTFATVAELRDAGINAVPHLSWDGDDPEAVLALLRDYIKLGVDRIVALRGDLPSGSGTTRQLRHAEALVHLIRARMEAPLKVEVAASKSPPIPRFTPTRRRPAPTSTISNARSTPVPTVALRSTSTTPTPTSTSWTDAPRLASASRSCPA